MDFSGFNLISGNLVLGQNRLTIDVLISIFKLWKIEISVMSAWLPTVQGSEEKRVFAKSHFGSTNQVLNW